MLILSRSDPGALSSQPVPEHQTDRGIQGTCRCGTRGSPGRHSTLLDQSGGERNRALQATPTEAVCRKYSALAEPTQGSRPAPCLAGVNRVMDTLALDASASLTGRGDLVLDQVEAERSRKFNNQHLCRYGTDEGVASGVLYCVRSKWARIYACARHGALKEDADGPPAAHHGRWPAARPPCVSAVSASGQLSSRDSVL